MELSNEFDVAAPIDDAWKVLTDLETIAPCMPGAQLTEVEGDDYRGTVKIKVGPITAKFKGTASFVEQDVANHRAVLRAKGKDTGGKGNADATITAQLSPAGTGTHVVIDTDLAISGRVAQFGRGALADVSSKLLGQFVDCLQARIGSGPDSEAGSADASDGPGTSPEAPPTGAPSAAPPVASVPDPVAARTAPRTPPSPAKDDALDLGATVLPILARTYWRQVAGALLVLVVVWRVLRRRR